MRKTFNLNVICPDDRVNGIYEINLFVHDGYSAPKKFCSYQCTSEKFVDALRFANTRLSDALEYD